MPVDDWLCMGCGAEKICIYRKGADIMPQACPECGDTMSINFSRRHINYGDEGEFRAYYSDTYPPDPADPGTTHGRWIRSKSDLKRLEAELAQEDAFIKGGRSPDTIPMVREQRRNIGNYGPEYLDALDEERRRKAEARKKNEQG